jgi:hypothetical protein
MITENELYEFLSLITQDRKNAKDPKIIAELDLWIQDTKKTLKEMEQKSQKNKSKL